MFLVMSKLILGLDISSTTIGLSLIEEENEKFSLKHYEYFKPDKKQSLFESLNNVRQWILKKLNDLTPDDVVLEDISEHFSVAGSNKGKSTSKTIIKLAVYNRTIGLAVYEWLGRDPVLMNVNTTRALIKPEGYKGRLDKKDVPNVVAAIMDIEFPWIYKRTGSISDESYDMADAMAVALASRALELVKK
jgi:Holliday junction resolvasome RuvABC endonuclease subunit